MVAVSLKKKKEEINGGAVRRRMCRVAADGEWLRFSAGILHGASSIGFRAGAGCCGGGRSPRLFPAADDYELKRLRIFLKTPGMDCQRSATGVSVERHRASSPDAHSREAEMLMARGRRNLLRTHIGGGQKAGHTG